VKYFSQKKAFLIIIGPFSEILLSNGFTVPERGWDFSDIIHRGPLVAKILRNEQAE
jgi:hypothetical protein